MIKSKRYLVPIALAFVVCLSLKAQINIPFGISYTYLKGTTTSLSSDWVNPAFDDSAWATGDAPFRYGDGAGGTLLSDMLNNYTTVFLRADFTAARTSDLASLQFSINYDDGFAIWINGELALTQNAPSTITPASTATALHESGYPELFSISASDVPLVDGTNTIAVVVLNEKVESTDLYFDMSVSATPILQGENIISIGHSSGYYSSAFTTNITCNEPGAVIYYTLDGSDPQNSATRISGGTSTNVSINPESTAGRTATPGVVMRISASKAGFSPSFPVARTYIFTEKVKEQTHPGGDWPQENLFDRDYQYMYYDMSPEVVNDSRYKNLIDDALLDIPTISIITSQKYFWDADSGIYVNAEGHGRDWERESSVELFYPDGREGFNVNAGLRIRGGYSRHTWYPKHAFRIFFRSEYGNAKLEYPLFEDEGVSQYDKMDLRCAQNYSWANGFRNNTMVREVFSRDTQRDMDQPYTRSRYYHLYLNGMYWGVFQTQERSEARFASDYFGDSKDDYDVVKVSTEDYCYCVETTDGNLEAWDEIYSLIDEDLSKNENYFLFEGKDANGKPMPGGKKLVEMDNLIDYMLTIFYAGNFDAPTSTFMRNTKPNNFYAVYNRNDDSKGFIFFNHDGEHALMVDETSPGIGIDENRVDLGTRTGGNQMLVGSLYEFHPQWLHFKLSDNEEYRMRFTDRASMHMVDEGALSPDQCLARFNERVAQIETAVIAESARWGNALRSPASTKDDHWLPTIEQVQHEFFPYRGDIVIDQLIQESLLSNVTTPLLKAGKTTLYNGIHKLTENLQISIENTNSSGDLYYTTNGKDPRAVGGGVAANAIHSDNAVVMNIKASIVLKARILQNGKWSAIRDVTFVSDSDDYSKLKVTEIHYHPLDVIVGTDTTFGKSFEFIEFRNTGETALDISGFILDSAVYCEFPPNSILAPEEYFVAAAKPTKFYEMYGYVASANFSGSLSNGGEEILLLDSQGNEVMRFTYDDHFPWPEEPDGSGPSMVSADPNPTGDPGDPYYWRTSYRIGGSPFESDTPLSLEDESITNMTRGTWFKVFPNPTSGQVSLRINGAYSGGNVNLMLYNLSGALVYSTQINSDFELDLNGFNIDPGMYILRLGSIHGIETYKLVYNP